MKKRFLALLIVLALLCALPFQAIALTDNEGPDESIDSILLKEIDVDPVVKNAIVDSFLDEANFELQENDTVVLSKNYIQVSRPQNDGSIQSSFITGINENGPIDFEDIAKDLVRASWTATYYSIPNLQVSQYSHITITFTCYYFRGVNWEGYRFYRPYQLIASWAPTSGNTVSNLTGLIEYVSQGQLINSNCLGDNLSYNDLVALVIYTFYQHDITINITSPLAPNTSVSKSRALPDGTALWFSNYYFHGSSIGYQFSYTCNGSNYNVSYYSVNIGSYY